MRILECDEVLRDAILDEFPPFEEQVESDRTARIQVRRIEFNPILEKFLAQTAGNIGRIEAMNAVFFSEHGIVGMARRMHVRVDHFSTSLLIRIRLTSERYKTGSAYRDQLCRLRKRRAAARRAGVAASLLSRGL